MTACAPPEPKGPLVLAASSLQEPLENLAEQWTKAGYDPPQMSFGSSATLARQIEGGAAGDIFISADQQWTDYLAQAGRIDPQAIHPIARNTLIIAKPVSAGTAPASIDDLETAATLITGDPDSVPLGRYAREALTSMGLWQAAKPKIAGAVTARAALVLLQRQEAEIGILYASDTTGAEDITAAAIPSDSHSPIIYLALQLPASAHPDAQAFLTFIASPEAAKLFRGHGFKQP